MTVSLLQSAGAAPHPVAEFARTQAAGALPVVDTSMDIALVSAAFSSAGPSHANLSRLSLDAEFADDIDWMWPRSVPACGLTIICASRQAGATAVALDIASRVSTGMRFHGEASGAARRHASQVLFVTDGPTRKRLAPRLAAVEAALDRCLALPLVQAADHTLDLAPVEAALARLRGDCRLVVFDALRVGLWRDGELDDESTQLFESLESLAERFGVAALAVVRLPGISNPSRRALGALASCVAALSTFVVLRDETFPEHRSLYPLRCVGDADARVFRLCHGPAGTPPAVEWRVEPGEVADGSGLAPGSSAAERRSAAEWLRHELRHGSRALSDLKMAANGDGYSWSTVQRAKRRLRVVSTKVAEGQTRWALRQETWSAMAPARPPVPGEHGLACVAMQQVTVQRVVVQQVDAMGWKAALLGEVQPFDQCPPLDGGQGGQKINFPQTDDP